MDKAIANALQRQKDLGRELAEIDAFLAMYKKFGGETDAEQTVPVVPSPPTSIADAFAGVKIVPQPPRHGRRVSPDEIANAAVRIIRDGGKPLTRVELVAALTDQGMEIRSVDPVNYVGTIMWRHGKDRVVSLDGHGYWLADESYAPAGYEPGTFVGNMMKVASDLQASADDDVEAEDDAADDALETSEHTDEDAEDDFSSPPQQKSATPRSYDIDDDIPF